MKRETVPKCKSMRFNPTPLTALLPHRVKFSHFHLTWLWNADCRKTTTTSFLLFAPDLYVKLHQSQLPCHSSANVVAHILDLKGVHNLDFYRGQIDGLCTTSGT